MDFFNRKGSQVSIRIKDPKTYIEDIKQLEIPQTPFDHLDHLIPRDWFALPTETTTADIRFDRSEIKRLIELKRSDSNEISKIQVADQGLRDIRDMLGRLRHLGYVATFDIVNSYERAQLNEEFQFLKKEIENLAIATEFNGRPLLQAKPRNLKINVNTREFGLPAYDQLYLNPYEFLEDEEEEDWEDWDEDEIPPGIGVPTKKEALESLPYIDGVLGNVENISRSVDIIEQRLMTNFEAKYSQRLEIDQNFLQNAILTEPEQAILSHADIEPDRAWQYLKD